MRLLVRRPGAESPVRAPAVPGSRSGTRIRGIARVLWLTFALNLGIAAAKLVFGHITGSLAMTADGVHALLDCTANVMALVGLGVARRPPDENHPYGHRKYETFATLGIAGMMFLGCREILGEALGRLRHPVPPRISVLAFVVMGVTILGNL